ncbi:MAG: urea ABC transporter ATP-binding protein UrtD [Gammaproteobacteria bacterium]|nr:urea ABC transporter ATP-binding protein UrtD [Gammaproteobacteria bacterium]MDE0411395.1 urea ABC transporter ATP-binding protein UrtD [Gammaproteobacteria bacterium]
MSNLNVTEYPAIHVPGESILYLDGVSVSFDGFKAIDNLSLYIKKNELRCIIGPNGAGKTTMMDIITGKTRPDAGRVIFGDMTDLTSMSEAEIANMGIGRKFQKPTVFENHTVYDNLKLALKGRRRVFENLFFKLSCEDDDKIRDVLKTIALQNHECLEAGKLSHGQKQWLEIGMLLVQDPKLLLVDEPVAGMTRQETELTAELLTWLAEKHSVVVVEHDMEFVRSLATRVTVLHQGSVLAEGSIESVQENPRVVEVYLGEGQYLT